MDISEFKFELEKCLLNNMKLAAVKLVYDNTILGLKDSKELIDKHYGGTKRGINRIVKYITQNDLWQKQL